MILYHFSSELEAAVATLTFSACDPQECSSGHVEVSDPVVGVDG